MRVFLAGVPPAIVVAVGLLAGDVVAYAAPCFLPLWAVVVHATGAAVVVAGSRSLRSLGLGSAAFLLGFVRASAVYAPQALPGDHIVHLPLPGSYELEAEIVSGNFMTGRKATVVLEALRVRRGGAWHEARGRVRVTLRSARATWAEGTRLRAFLKLRKPRDFGNRGEFAYTAYLARQGIYVTAWVDSDGGWERLAESTGPFGSLVRWRLRVAAVFERVASPQGAAVLRALVLGDQSTIAPELREIFSRLGVGHVLSISGLHVALVAGAGYAAARWILSRSEFVLLYTSVPKLAACASFAPVLLYGTIAGDNVATRRAIFMLGAVIGALLYNREAHLFTVLAVAALVVVLHSPGATGDISFQLSFVAVWSLAVAGRAFRRWWPQSQLVPPGGPQPSKWRRVYSYATYYVAASLWLSSAATVATAPLTAWHFNHVALLAPLANLCVVPILGSLAVLLGLLAAFAEPCSSTLAAAFAYAGSVVVDWGAVLMRVLDRVPFASTRVATPKSWEVAAWFAVLLGVAHGERWGRRVAMAAALVAMTASGALRWLHENRQQALALTFLSVGQASATLVEFPGGIRWLVDAGGLGDGSFDVGGRVIAPALWARGILHLDAVALTHPQFDHYGSLPAVVRLFRPAWFFHNGEESDAFHYRRLRKTLNAQAVFPVALLAGAERCIGGVHVSVWNPQGSPRERNPNEDSLVLLFQYGGRAVLLPGDIESRAERALLASADWSGIDVLNVPHHGSRTSSTEHFVATLRPRLAIVSLGWQNRFGFPHAEVRRRYAAAGSWLLRTDLDGAIEVVIERDGTLRWRTARPPWSQWQVEALSRPPAWPKFVDSMCAGG